MSVSLETHNDMCPRHSHGMTKETRPKDLEALETPEVANFVLSF